MIQKPAKEEGSTKALPLEPSPWEERFHKWAVLAFAFITGACGIAYEYNFSKLASDLLGNTIQEWALTIAVMLFAMGMGADIQKRIHAKHLFSSLMIVEILLSLVGGWGGFLLLEIFTLKRLYFTFVQMTLHFAVGFMIGMEIPLLMRMNARFKPTLAKNLGQIFRLDYWGGFVGALVWVYVLIDWLPTTLDAAFAISLFNLLGAVIALFAYRKAYVKKRGFILFCVLTLGAILSCVYGWVKLPQWTPALEQRLFADKVITSLSTPYQQIVLTESREGELRMYLNGQLQFSSRDEYIYHEMLVHPALWLQSLNLSENSSNAPKEVLILGGGEGLALRELLKYPTVAKVSLVDIDKELIELAQTHSKLTALNEQSLIASRTHLVEQNISVQTGEVEEVVQIDRSKVPHQIGGTHSVSLYTIDAYTFLKTLREVSPSRGYDVIIADFPDPNKVELSKLYALSFYKYLGALLKPDGVFVQQASSPYYAKETFRIVGATLRQAGFSVVPLHALVPSFGEWGWYIAQKSKHRSSEEIYQELYDHFEPLVPTRGLDPTAMKRALLFSKGTHPLRAEGLSASDKPLINTLLNHLAYKTYRTELRQFQ